MGLLDKKVAIITGAGGGLGEAYARLFAKEGASVVVNDLGGPRDGSGKDATMAQKIAESIVKDGGKAIANGSDISTMEGGETLFNDCIKAFGKCERDLGLAARRRPCDQYRGLLRHGRPFIRRVFLPHYLTGFISGLIS